MRTIQSFPSLNPSADVCELLETALRVGHEGVEMPAVWVECRVDAKGGRVGRAGQLLLRYATANGAYGGLDAVDDTLRGQAVDRFCSLLRTAGRIGASLVTVCGASGLPPGESSVPIATPGTYADRLYALLRSLRRAAEHAEIDGVRVAIEPACDGLLLSPVEVRDLIETINSPYVGVCLDVDRLASISRPTDWIHTLRHRVLMVRRPNALVGQGHSAWQPCEAALGEIAYDSPISVTGEDRLSTDVIDQRRRSADVRDDNLAGKR